MKASSWVNSFLSGRAWTAPATIVSFALESEMFPSVDEAHSFVYRGLRQLLSSGAVTKDFRGHYRLVQDCGGLSAAEWDTCWMAVRYAVGGQSISTSLLPFELLSAYWRRWSVGEKARLLSILNDHLDSVRRLTGESEVCFGSPMFDHKQWELFRRTLDSGQHVEVSLTSGKVLTCVEYDGNYYPISGDLPWWTGQGFPCFRKDVIVGGGVQV